MIAKETDMGGETAYRTRAREVRRAARQHLAQLRAARGDRTRPAAPPAPEAEAACDARRDAAGGFQPDADMLVAAGAFSHGGAVERPPQPGDASTGDVDAVSEAGSVAHGGEVAAGRVADFHDAAQPGPLRQQQHAGHDPTIAWVDTAVPEPIDALAPEPDDAPTPEPVDAPTPEPVDAPAPEPACADADADADDIPEDRTSDLYLLPGAGSGLVWMLEQSGIDSLEGLARADVARLETSLGLVGQLLDVAGWVAFARQQTEANGNPDPRA